MNDHFSMFSTLCDTLREATRILNSSTKPGHVKRAAQSTIDAVEPVAISLFDEEYAPILRARNVALASCAPGLARHVAQIINGKARLDEEHWRKIIVCSKPDHIDFLVREVVFPRAHALPLLERVLEGYVEFEATLHRAAMEDDDISLTSPDFQGLFTHCSRPEVAGSFLRTQIEYHPKQYAHFASKAAFNHDGELLVKLYLAGAEMPELRRDGRQDDFLKLVQSNHGKLKVLAELGSLEDVLSSSGRTIRFLHNISVHAKAA